MKHFIPPADVAPLTLGILALNGLETAPVPKRPEPVKPAQKGEAGMSGTDLAREDLHRLETLLGLVLEQDAPDWGLVERLSGQISEASTLLRETARIEMQPPAPEYEPASSTADPYEVRTYAGVKASRLSSVTKVIARLKTAFGLGHVKSRVARLSLKLGNGLKTFVAVKALIRKLETAVDYPERAIKPRPYGVKHTRETQSFTWDISPQEHYNWKLSKTLKGYDPRHTSLYWLKAQSAKLRRDMYNGWNGVKVQAKSEPPQTSTYHGMKTFTPPKGADNFDQVWPPIDLEQIIKDRAHQHTLSAHSTRSESGKLSPDVQVTSPEGDGCPMELGLSEGVAYSEGYTNETQTLETDPPHHPNSKLHPD